mgnify:CR=1 FL=1
MYLCFHSLRSYAIIISPRNYFKAKFKLSPFLCFLQHWGNMVLITSSGKEIRISPRWFFHWVQGYGKHGCWHTHILGGFMYGAIWWCLCSGRRVLVMGDMNAWITHTPKTNYMHELCSRMHEWELVGRKRIIWKDLCNNSRIEGEHGGAKNQKNHKLNMGVIKQGC